MRWSDVTSLIARSRNRDAADRNAPKQKPERAER